MLISQHFFLLQYICGACPLLMAMLLLRWGTTEPSGGAASPRDWLPRTTVFGNLKKEISQHQHLDPFRGGSGLSSLTPHLKTSRHDASVRFGVTLFQDMTAKELEVFQTLRCHIPSQKVLGPSKPSPITLSKGASGCFTILLDNKWFRITAEVCGACKS